MTICHHHHDIFHHHHCYYEFSFLWWCSCHVDYNIRRRQGILAKQSGMYGFIFYHFWFSGKSSPIDHKVMFKVPGKIELNVYWFLVVVVAYHHNDEYDHHHHNDEYDHHHHNDANDHHP